MTNTPRRTAHAECKHPNTKAGRAVCRKIRAIVDTYYPLTEKELGSAMTTGTLVTGWDVYDSPVGVVMREVTGTLDYVETLGNGKKIWTIRFQIDPTGETCPAGLESACTYPTGRIRFAG